MRIDKLTIGAALAAALLLSGCATLPPGSKPDPRDRFERANRSVYAFNTAVDHAILRPVAHGYVKITPKPVRRGISNFLANIDYPITILNDALQGKAHDGLSDIARFGINTVVGVGGLFDPATHWGFERQDLRLQHQHRLGALGRQCRRQTGRTAQYRRDDRQRLRSVCFSAQRLAAAA